MTKTLAAVNHALADIGPALFSLQAENVELARNGRVFARLPSLEAKPGECVALVGPSGSGKSTAIMSLAGIRAPHAGRIAIQGTDLWKSSASWRDTFRATKIGLIFQSFHLVDAISVRNNIRLAARWTSSRGIDLETRLDLLLRRLDLEKVRDSRADRISHGQAQRVAVARALLNRPAIILADEPTSALDNGNAESLLSLLMDNATQEDAALVIATHDRRVLDWVDRVVEMEPVA